ncbi:P protein-like [Sitodiplosis mosellana]|uniref:P protein-like n=1 Tax=Sitodiplosis mosellana TaxID=263140 RepID=UPI0024441A3F|nr:P protein-like [Sitodiplosis mosellana]
MKSLRKFLLRKNAYSRLELDSSVVNISYGAFDEHIPSSNETYVDIQAAKNDGECTTSTICGIETTNNTTKCERKNSQKVLNVLKILFLLIIWMLSTGILMSKDEKVLKYHQLVISVGQNKSYMLNEAPLVPRIGVIVRGAFADDNSNTSNFVYIKVQQFITATDTNLDSTLIDNDEMTLKIPIIENISNIDTANEINKFHTFYLDANIFQQIVENITTLRLQITTNLPINFPINLAYDSSPIDKSMGVIYAAAILIGLYIMIIWEIVDRTFAAMLSSTIAIAVLSLMNERPTMPEILSWIDVETLLLLFGMMILVGLLSRTGLFDYLAVYAFEIAKGRIWPLIYCLCLFTAILSAILDNVTTLLLMTPISIRLCEAMKLNPIPILTTMIIFSNIGGAMTPVGDPPNIIIASNPHVVKHNVDFLNFTIHMSVGAIFVIIQTFLQLRLKFRTIGDLRVINSMTSCIREEIADDSTISIETYGRMLEELKERYPIRKLSLLIKSAVAFAFVLGCFFLHSLPYIGRLSLGWITLLGVILLLILYDRRTIESALERVEWSTLLFFAILFVLMESLAKLGLIHFVGNQAKNIVLSVSEGSRLAVAILIILWVSALASAFVDNIPLTTMMIRITVSLAETQSLNLPLQPLLWALSFGACLGGNGTLIGASSNIVCASVAEKHGYHFTFMKYFKIAFPAMIGSLVVISGYLYVSHVFFTWH